MADGKLFIVVPKADAVGVEVRARDLTIPGRRGEIVVFGVPGAGKVSSAERSAATAKLIAQIGSYPPNLRNRLFINREAKCSFEDLNDWWCDEGMGDPDTRTLASAALRRELKEHLEATGAFWRSNATMELERFEGRRGSLDGWLQQFAELDVGGIGQKLAARLRVVRTGEMPNGAFALREADQVGLRFLACYVEDDDQGGSWVEMKGLLERTFPPGSVHPIRWRKDVGVLDFPSADVDEIIIHEDGLWSGHEVVKRLRAIAANPPKATVTLRYGIVTNFGLLVARQAIRALELDGRVLLDTSRSELLDFIAIGLPDDMRRGVGMDPNDYYVGLHDHVKAYAFELGGDWSAEEVATCADIGGQLVRQWHLRENGEEASEETVARFALGGGGFASMVAFSRSVPKVCLPLLWLGGEVRLGDRTVAWRPLLVDARRVSDEDLLHSSST